MEKSIQIVLIFFVIILSLELIAAQERWNYSAKVIEGNKVDGTEIRQLNEEVKFVKTNKLILTDKAAQHIKDDVLYLSGNTMMISDFDTLTCDSMVYWSKLDSGYAVGNVRYIQSDNKREITTDIFHYWQTDGYRGSSFIADGFTRIIETGRLIAANKIIYNDDLQLMNLFSNASIEDVNRGLLGDQIEIQYTDSTLDKVFIDKKAFAYNNLDIRVKKEGSYQKFRDEMSSTSMLAIFKNEKISNLNLYNMASTLYHVVDDSLLAGVNNVSGDTISIYFSFDELSRLEVKGGAQGEFEPEGDNTRIDTTIFYGAEYIDYHIDKRSSFLSNNAFLKYENTELNSGNILINWDTNILDASSLGNELPSIKTKGESPMTGDNMVFDLIEKHGRIIKGNTALNQGIYHGNEVFRDEPNIFHVNKSKYTSCDLQNPHFYLGSKQMKMIPGDRVIAKPLWLHIYDVPIIGLPLAVFPNKSGNRQSGWIMPSFDSYKSIGTGFRNFGYYWAPNYYMDEKIVINFFDKQGIHINSYFKYKKRSGGRWYNFQYNGHLSGTFKRRVVNKKIENLFDDEYVKEDQRISWSHTQKFDPTQRLAIKYEYISNKDAYQNDQEVDLANRLKQNLSSSFNYSKNWKTNSLSIGFNQFRDMSIENKSPNAFNYLNNGRYKPYKYEDGPKFNFRVGSRKFFGRGDKWYNKINTSYSMNASLGRKDHWLVKNDEYSWNINDTTKIKHGGIKHSAQINAPQTFFKWLTINPNISLREDWIFTYLMLNNIGNEIEGNGFKRRLTWNSSISAKTKIYGLFPIKINKLYAIRHVITPTISYKYQPDFSSSQYGGDLYFQNNETDSSFDYFRGSYVGSTSKTEKKIYSISINNVFQAKILNEKGKYSKSNFLTWNSSFSYNTVKDSLKLSEISSNVRVKNLSGNELFRVRMYHSFYKLDDNTENIIDELIDFKKGSLPRLTRINISTDLKLKLTGSKRDQKYFAKSDSTEKDIEDIFYSSESQAKNRNSNNIWDSKLQFKYSADWKYTDDEWDYKFSVKTVNSINITRKWTLSYIADFNLKDKEMTYHSLRVYRPLHCWEFSFNFWPRGNSSGFSLRINVKNPELQDIKITSKDGRRGFSGF